MDPGHLSICHFSTPTAFGVEHRARSQKKGLHQTFVALGLFLGIIFISMDQIFDRRVIGVRLHSHSSHTPGSSCDENSSTGASCALGGKIQSCGSVVRASSAGS